MPDDDGKSPTRRDTSAAGVALVVVAAAGAVLGFSVALMFLDRADARPQRAVARVRIDHPADHWSRRGYARMVPPVRLPTDAAESDRIAVWLKVPERGRVTVRTVDGRPRLRFPPGTEADRVESFGDAVIDVRGTTLAAGGAIFHVLVPTAASTAAPLAGVRWRSGDDDAQRVATGLLAGRLRRTRTLQDARVNKRVLIEEYKRNNACARCHTADKPVDLKDPHAIHRATDDDGFFVPQSVLEDAVPVETHRPRDVNAGDPFLSFECPGGRAATLFDDGFGARAWRCDDGAVPVGVLDVKAALAARDAHAAAVCASRRYLWEHMDDRARAAFARAFLECGI